jgi:lysyl-tRNA synthetase class 2
MGKDTTPYYLQTSPEYHMKRLIAAGSGSIFQMSKAFRVDDVSKIHNPEFTLLEWYRIGFDLFQLMDEVEELLQLILKTTKTERYTYHAIFQKILQIDPFTASLTDLKQCAFERGFTDPGIGDDKDDWLLILFSYYIESHLQTPTFIYHFPASQAVLSKIDKDDQTVCGRVELYAQGIELGNGFHELTDASEQRARFMRDNQKRTALGINQMNLDEYFLAALQAGLPECSGIAIGLDRLIMAALRTGNINDVLAFPFPRA